MTSWLCLGLVTLALSAKERNWKAPGYWSHALLNVTAFALNTRPRDPDLSLQPRREGSSALRYLSVSMPEVVELS